MTHLAVGPDRLLRPPGSPLPNYGFDFVRATRWMKQYLSTSHCRNAIQLRVPSVATDNKRAHNPIDLKQGELISASAIFLFVASCHVDLGIFVNDFSLWRNHMRDVQVTVRSLAQRTRDNPYASSPGCAACLV